mgnify:CR=1 FL=1
MPNILTACMECRRAFRVHNAYYEKMPYGRTCLGCLRKMRDEIDDQIFNRQWLLHEIDQGREESNAE